MDAATPLDLTVVDVVTLTDGGVALTALGSVVVKLDSVGGFEWGRVGAGAPGQMMVATGTSDGLAVASFRDLSRPIVDRLALDGSEQWSYSYPLAAGAGAYSLSMRSMPDGGFAVASASAFDGSSVLKLDGSGAAIECGSFVATEALQPMSATVGPALLAPQPYSPATVPIVPIPVAVTFPFDRTCHNSNCPPFPSPIAEVTAVKVPPLPSVCMQLAWRSDPNASAYAVWTVPAKGEIDLARRGGSASALEVPANPCEGLHFPAVFVRFFQVRGLCDDRSEWP